MSEERSETDLTAAAARDVAGNWPVDADGYPHRQAARVVLLDPCDRCFLIFGHDYADRNHCWWFTVGGGMENGESLRETAVRELAEETGLSVSVSRLIGPVLLRRCTFNFVREVRKQDETYFLLRVTQNEADLLLKGKNRNLTYLEKHVLDEYRWWTFAQMNRAQAAGTVIYPPGLARMCAHWARGWDGKTREITQ